MIHQIYSCKKTEQDLRQGQLGAFVDELATVLLEKGYPKKYLVPRFAVIGELSRWLIQRKIKLCDLTQPQINQFIQYRSKQTSVVKRGETATLDILLEVLRSHGCIPTTEPEEKSENEIEEIVGLYNQYLVEEQGLSPATIINYLMHVRYFLSDVFNSKPININNFCAQNITEFILKYANEHSSVVSSLMVASLRSFFRFLLLRGKIAVDLASCVPTVANCKNNRIPQYLSPKELEHLLEHSKGETPLKVRNHAILLLLARFGFRASEVVRLTLDDIDWTHGEIIIRGKGARQTRFPLPVDVGEALVAYLKNGRPSCSTRRFFICARPPLKPLGNYSTVSSIVRFSLRRAGLNPPKKGAHLLRHTLGTDCLRKGATLPEVGEILRHRQVDTTAIYAKVDFARLETIAQPWPDKSMAGGVL